MLFVNIQRLNKSHWPSPIINFILTWVVGQPPFRCHKGESRLRQLCYFNTAIKLTPFVPVLQVMLLMLTHLTSRDSTNTPEKVTSVKLISPYNAYRISYTAYNHSIFHHSIIHFFFMYTPVANKCRTYEHSGKLCAWRSLGHNHVLCPLLWHV